MSEEYEDRLLTEAETMQDLIGVFSRLESYLGEVLKKKDWCLDDNLCEFLTIVQSDIAYLVGARVVKYEYGKDKKKTRGLIALYDETMKNIDALQAGLPCREGVEFEE